MVATTFTVGEASMYWGAGPKLGLLTLLGYLSFIAGAADTWRARADVSVWLYSEVGVLRRNLSRYTPAGPFYIPRKESRLTLLPSFFVNAFRRMPRARLYRSVILLLIAPLLVVLDFFF
jgi:hypothetical protein